ncbi:MAG: UvrD-helicase domain-containing protein [Clostridia bacterium]|nr:UvrD-helicase domain-containing protein [Clostridia bacterium]
MQLKKEQYSAINEHDGENLLISASAGSGKTFVMIERIIRLIRQKKLKVDELLAVTFTEKAAYEMKEKLTEALINSINAGERSFKKELLSVATADICTIDAFCSRLVKRYFYELNIGRDFEILSESDKSKLIAEAMEKTFKLGYESKELDFLNLVKRYSERRSTTALKELIFRIYNYASSESDFEKWLSVGDTVYTENGFLELISRYETVVKDKLLYYARGFDSASEKAISLGIAEYADSAKTSAEIIRDMAKATSLEELKSLVYENPKLPSLKLKDEKLLAFKEAFQRLRNTRKTSINDLLSNIKTQEEYKTELDLTKLDYFALKKVVLEFKKNYDELKVEENKFEFNDIEKFALKLLQNKEVAQSIRNKYKYVFIDEYQDVNGVQEEIFSIIANDNEFMVGDIKQSIYAFRGCNSDLFQQKFDKLNESKQTLTLNHNFRSADGVISAVNQVFDEVILMENFGIDYKKDARLVPGGLYPEGAGSCTLHIVTPPVVKKETVDPEIYDIKKATEKESLTEEDCVSIKVKQIINSVRGKSFYDIKSKKERQVELKDIVILCRKRTSTVTSLIKNLTRSGISVVSEIEQSVLDAKEVKLLIAFIELLDNLKQDIPLVLCMMSKIGKFTPNEIATIRQKCPYNNTSATYEKPNFYDCYKNALTFDDALGEKVRAFDEYIKSMRFLADFKSAKFVLEKVIRDKKLSAYTLIGKFGANKEKKVIRFLSESVSMDKELSLREFLYKIKNSPESFTVTETAGDDSVTIMTKHKSKGLEFPVVIIIGLEKSISDEDVKKKVYLDRKYGIALPVFFDENKTYGTTIFKEVVKSEMLKNQYKDEARLFYVAMTRAKHDLHMISVEKKEENFPVSPIDATKYYDFIPKSFPRVKADENLLLNDNDNSSREILVGKRNNELIEKIKKNLSFTYPYLQDTVLPLKTSVTKNLSEEELGEYYLFDDGAIDVSDGVIDAETGTKVHKVLEFFDFTKDDVSAELERVLSITKPETDGLTAENLSALKTVLKSPLFKELSGADLYREQYFVTKLCADEIFENKDTKTKVMLQGVIDLLAIKDGNAYIVDYKYSSKNPDALAKTYIKQLKLYKTAVETALKIKVKKVALVNLYKGYTLDFDAKNFK